MTTNIVQQIRKATRRRFTAEEKIRIVLEGLRGEIPVTEVCRKEGIQPSIYYKWSKAFLEAGKNGFDLLPKNRSTPKVSFAGSQGWRSWQTRFAAGTLFERFRSRRFVKIGRKSERRLKSVSVIL